MSVSEDGDMSVSVVDEAELLKRITPDEDGETYYGDTSFLSEQDLAKNGDPMYWSKRLLIIRGEVVVPRPKKVVSAYEL